MAIVKTMTEGFTDPNDIQRFINIPNYDELSHSKEAFKGSKLYYQTMTSKIRAKYKDTKGEITVLTIDFIKEMVKSASSLYSNRYKRSIANIDDLSINGTSLKDAFVKLEQFITYYKQSALWFSTDENDEINIQALDPTQFFSEDGFTFVKLDNNTVRLYTHDEDFNIQSIYEYTTKRAINFANIIYEYNIKQSPMEQSFIVDDIMTVEELSMGVDSVDKVPLLVITEEDYVMPEKSGLVDLQDKYISDMSWGFFTSESKLMQQITATSDLDFKKLQERFANFGKHNHIVSLERGDDIKVFDTGSIEVLMNFYTIYNKAINQKALQMGADARAIIPQEAKVESGEAKVINQQYRNNKRATRFSFYEKVESRVWSYVSELFGIDVQYEGIRFYDIDLKPSLNERINIALRLLDEGLENRVGAYAFIHGLTEQEAEEEMRDKGILNAPLVSSSLNNN